MKNNKIILIVAIVCILLYIIPNVIFYCNIGINGLSDKPSDWGVYGDFIGGSLNPLLAIFNIIALVYLTYTVSISDDKRITSQFRYEAYVDLKSKLKPFLNDEATRYTNQLKEDYKKMEDALVAFQQYSAFLFSSNVFNEKLHLLIDEVKLAGMDLNNLMREDTLVQPKGTIGFFVASRTKEDEVFFEKREKLIINMKLELLDLMQNKILN